MMGRVRIRGAEALADFCARLVSNSTVLFEVEQADDDTWGVEFTGGY